MDQKPHRAAHVRQYVKVLFQKNNGEHFTDAHTAHELFCKGVGGLHRSDQEFPAGNILLIRRTKLEIAQRVCTENSVPFECTEVIIDRNPSAA